MQPLWKTVWRFSQKTKNRTIIWSSNSTPGYIYMKKTKNTNSKRYMHPNVHSSTIYNSQVMETTKVSVNRQMQKEVVLYLYNGILFNHKKEWNTAFAATWLALENIILSEVSQTEKDKYYNDSTHMWNRKK